MAALAIAEMQQAHAQEEKQARSAPKATGAQRQCKRQPGSASAAIKTRQQQQHAQKKQ